MITNYKAVLILSATVLLNHAFGAEETGCRTFNGTRLELILQAEDGGIVSNNLGILTEEERNDFNNSFRVIPLRNVSYLASGFYLFDSSGGIEKFLYTEESKAFVHPSKDGSRYLVCKGAYSNFNFDDYSPVIKELYDMENKLIWAYEIKGHVMVSDDLNNVLIRNMIRGPGIAVINGGVYRHIYPGYCGNPFCISTDGEIIVISEHNGPVPVDEPKGTRVYDNTGRLLFTLDPNFVADLGSGTQKIKRIYASDKYIIQICLEVKRAVFDPPAYDNEGKEVEELTTVSGIHYIQVYNRNGEFLWQQDFASSEFIASFTLSDNEEHIAVFLPESEPECKVYDMSTGREKYSVNLPAYLRHLSDAAISNDGSKVSVIVDNWGRSPGNYVVKGKALLLLQGREVAAFEHTYDYNETDGSFNVIFSEKGDLFVITANRGFRLLRISSD